MNIIIITQDELNRLNDTGEADIYADKYSKTGKYVLKVVTRKSFIQDNKPKWITIQTVIDKYERSMNERTQIERLEGNLKIKVLTRLLGLFGCSRNKEEYIQDIHKINNNQK